MSRNAKVMLFVMVAWKELVDAGLAHPLKQDILPSGIALYDQLKAEGFEPTEEEMRDGLNFLRLSGVGGELK